MTRRAIISGIGDTPVGELPGSTPLGLQADAALAAIADAGLAVGDVDGVLCAYSLTEPHLMAASVVAEHLAIQPVHASAIQAGGASGGIMLMHAAALVESGACRHVLVVAGDNRLTGMTRDQAISAIASVGHPVLERPYGVTVPASYALVATRYMAKFGTTLEQLAAVAVAHREHAARHPGAHKRQPITIDDVMESRPIAAPLRLLDCCLISDGAAAVVISTPEAGRDLPKRAVGMLGAGQKHTHEHVYAARSLTEFGCHQSAAQAFGAAGVSPGDIDVAEIYDSFTITLLVQLESIGFFEPGQAGVAAAEGAFALDGQLPCNTHGGLLSYGHSGAAGGMFHFVEAVRQLRGEADARQVADAELSFVHNDGGILSAHSSFVLGRL